MPELEIIYKAIDDIIPYPFNNVDHPQEQINVLAGVIDETGFDQPIVIDENNVILKGHGRLESLKKLGITEVPCIVREGLTEIQKKKVRISDNKIGRLSVWNEENLALELEELANQDIDLTELGFDESELSSLLNQLQEEVEDITVKSWDDAMEKIPEGDKQPFVQKTFTLHDSQVEIVEEAIKLAKQNNDEFLENDNSNGNALYFISKYYVENYG